MKANMPTRRLRSACPGLGVARGTPAESPQNMSAADFRFWEEDFAAYQDSLRGWVNLASLNLGHRLASGAH